MTLPTDLSPTPVFRPRGARLLGVLLLLCGTPSVSQNLQDSGLALPGVWAGQAAWGDYDDDGDLDLVLTGEILGDDGATRRITRLFRNDSALLVEDVAQGDRLVGVYYGDAAWADYDNDGDLDLAVAGWDETGDESLRLYLNDQGDQAPDRLLTFDLSQVDELGTANLRGVRYASLAWADFDNDGDLDLVVSGMEVNGTSLTQVYANADGVLTLDVSNSEAVINVHNGDLSWADYDGDGDLDLALSGENVTTEGGLGAVTEFYSNDPVGSLGLDVALDLGADPVTGLANKVKGGSLAWADYDGDGNLDLAVSGRDAGLNAVLNLFRNRPAGNLSDDASFSLSRFQRVDGRLDWVDYDNDGDPDLAVAGRTSLSQHRALVLENRDGAITGISAESDLEGLSGGSALWGDYDGNGRVDLLVAGVDGDGLRRSILYSNLGTPIANRPPDPPATLNPAQVSSRRVVFSWSPGEDVESGSLTYNLRVGTEPGGDDIVSGRVAYGPGNAGLSPDFILERSLPPDRYYWSVQAVDGSLSRSDYSQEELFSVDQFVSSDQRIRSLTNSAMSWGDVDGDGDPDLAIMGTNRSGEAQTLVYANQSGTLVLQTAAGLTALRGGDLEWGDYDSDGDLDLFVAGEISPGNRNSTLYATTASASALSFEAALRFRPDVSDGAVAWGDADNDGDLDLLLMGQSGEVAEGSQLSFSRIYVNDGAGSFDATRDDSLVGLANGDAAWSDYDGDGDLDLALTGKSTAGVREFRLYRNDLPGLLVDSGAELPGAESSDLAWADYDRDGDPDLVAGGFTVAGVAATALYANDGGVLQSLTDVSLPGIKGGDLAWGDVDNDQDVDLLIVGNDDSGPIFRIYENTIGQIAPANAFEAMSAEVLVAVEFSAVAVADIDGDGDLDVATSGRDASLAPRTAVNENLAAQQFNPNFRPDPPLTLAAADSGDVVTLSWSAGTDDGAPPAESLTYDLRVGTRPGLGDVLAGNGALGFGARGSGGTQRLLGLASGTYYWTVRTVDAGLDRSAWSATSSFVIDTQPPELVSLSLGRTVAGIGQAVSVALEFVDAHAGVDIDTPPVVSAALGDSTYQLKQLQYTGTSWSGELVVAETMPSGPAQLSIAGVQDGKGNALAAFDSTDAFVTDTERPAVAATTPLDGEASVSASLDRLTITFSEALDPTAAEEVGNYSVRPGAALSSATYDEASRTVALALTEALRPGVDYTVEVSAAIADLVGNRAGNSASWSFETRVPSLVGTEPAAEAADVPVGQTQIAATFDSGILRPALDLEGSVTVLRGGAVVALAAPPSFDADTGVLSASLTEPFRAGSRYQVTLSGLLGGPLRATTEGDFGWSFNTAVPQVLAVMPDSGAAAVDVVLDEARVTFSFALDADAAVADNFGIFREGQAVALRPGDPVVRSAGVYGLAPAEGWASGTAYTVQIAPVVTGPLGVSQPISWQFQTAVPTVVATSPVDGQTIASGPRRVEVVFSSPVDEARITAANFRLAAGTRAVTLADDEFLYDPEAFAVSLPSVALMAGSEYELTVSSRLGGPRAEWADVVSSFQTGIPSVSSTVPADGSQGVSTSDASIDISFDGPLALTRVELFQVKARPLDAVLDGGEEAPFGLVRVAGFGSSADASSVSFSPAGGLQPFTEYRIEIAREAFGRLAEAGYDFTYQTAARLADPGDGGTVRSGDRSVELYFPPNALSGGTGEIAIRPAEEALAGKPVATAQSDLTQVGMAYSIDSGGGVLLKPATLTLRYSASELGDLDPARLGIFAQDGGDWRRLGGTADVASGKVTTAVDALGTVALFEDLSADVGSMAVRQVDCQPRAFAPGGTTLRTETDISFELTRGADVTVRVYSASGRLERLVAEDLPVARGRNTVSWDGRDDDGGLVPSGLYVVVVSAGSAQGEKVVAVVR